jgi:DamX protein
LGLKKDPFTEVSDEFFGEGDRGRQLEELRHLARWSRRLLAVTGERGVGKSTLYRALSSGLDPGVKAARINANLTSDTREVLAGIIHGFGMAAPANADPRLLIELISLHVREQIDAKRYCLVMIDDAHLLELRALEQMLKLTDSGTDEGLRMVFFAEPYFVQSLDKASKRTDQAQNWHEIRLTPFTDEESRRYVAFRLTQAGEQGKPVFTQNQLSVIVGGSSGLPGRIDELASAILSGELTISDERRWLPRMHRALVVLVLIAAGMGWLIFNGYPKHSAPEAPASNASDEKKLSAPVDNGATVAIALPPVETVEARQAPRSAAHEVEQSGAEAPSAARVESVTTGVSTQVPPPEQKPTRVAESEVVAVPPRPAAAAATPTQSAAPEREAKPTEAPRKAADANPTSEPTPPPSSAAGKPRTAQWLRQQPGKYFTLQLFATTSRDKRDRFVGQQDHAERFATFETRRDGALWYAVTYGSYATKTEATSAAAALPPSVGRVEPWVRTFASIQAILE